MSSTVFAVELRTDHRCRGIVFWSGIMLAGIGAALLAATSLQPLGRLMLMVLWLGDCGWALHRLRQGWQPACRLRLTSGGEVQLVADGELPVAVSLRTGSVVTRRVAWLRFARPGGPVQAELFLAAYSENYAWQRFQLVWRLAHGAFGHPGTA